MTPTDREATDRVREAREKFIEYVVRAGFMNPRQFPEEMAALDALITAVRAECGAEVAALREQVVQSQRNGAFLRDTLGLEQGSPASAVPEAVAALRAENARLRAALSAETGTP